MTCRGTTPLLAVAVTASLFVLFGCATPTPNDFARGYLEDHSVNVDARGAPELVVNGGLSSAHLKQKGVFTSDSSLRAAHDQYVLYQQLYRTNLDRMFNDIDKHAPRRDGRPQVLLYAHGGLNTEGGRLGRIEELIGSGALGSTNHITNHYAIFINWESGLLSSYEEHLTSVRQGRKYSRLSVAGAGAVPFVLLSDFGRAAANAPSVWYAQLATDIKSYGKSKSNWPNVDALTAEWTREKQIVITRHGDRTSLADTSYRLLIHVLTIPTKLAFAPLIDGLGEAAWRSMRRRTETMFRPVYEFDLTYDNRSAAPNKLGEALDDKASGALSVFLDELAERARRGNYEITLVGHSMGTIVLNGVIRRYPELPYARILYMAAACRIKDLETSVIPCMKVNTNVIFQNWCLSRRAEVAERNFVTHFDFAPRGSLLEWIDNYLDAPESFEDRALGKWENIIQSAQVFPKSIRSRVFLEEFGFRVPGDPQAHGEFGEQQFWAFPVKAELAASPGETRRNRGTLRSRSQNQLRPAE